MTPKQSPDLHTCAERCLSSCEESPGKSDQDESHYEPSQQSTTSRFISADSPSSPASVSQTASSRMKVELRRSPRTKAKQHLSPPTTPTPMPPVGKRNAQRSASAPQLAIPLTSEQRYVNEKVPTWSPNETHTMVLDYIETPLPKTNKTRCVYIFSDPDRLGIIKIGSAHIPQNRRDQLIKECRFRNLIIHFESDIMEKNVAMRVEHLAHHELGFFRRCFDCGACGTNHQEFFELDHQIAEVVIRRWARFLELKPYDADGKLKDGWKAKMSAYIGHRQTQPEQDHENHDNRGKWWEQLAKVLAPPVVEPAETQESESLSTPLVPDPNSWKRPMCSVIQGLVLFQTTQSWFVRMPNLIGIIIAGLLMDSHTVALVQESIHQLHIPWWNILRRYAGARCKGS